MLVLFISVKSFIRTQAWAGCPSVDWLRCSECDVFNYTALCTSLWFGYIHSWELGMLVCSTTSRNGHFMTQACVIILLLDSWGMYTTLTLSAVASSLEKVFWNRPMLSLGVYPRSKSKLWDSQVVKYNQREGSKVGDRFPLSSSILNRDANASLFKHGWCHCKI